MSISPEFTRKFVRYNEPKKELLFGRFETIEALECQLLELHLVRRDLLERIRDCRRISEMSEEEIKKQMITQVADPQIEMSALEENLKKTEEAVRAYMEEISVMKQGEEYQIDVLKKYRPRAEN